MMRFSVLVCWIAAAMYAAASSRDCADTAYRFASAELASVFRAEQGYAREHPEQGFSEALSALRSVELGSGLGCATPPCVVNGYRYTYRRFGKSKFQATATPLFPQVKSVELGMFPPTLVVDQSGIVRPVGSAASPPRRHHPLA